jgi:hypothetical protein
MAADDALIDWAREEAARLGRSLPSGTRLLPAPGPGLGSVADHAQGSTFKDLDVAVSQYGTESAIRTCAFQLEEWVSYQTSAAATVKPFGVRFRIEATDLMEQVHGLLRDRNIHPAAPIVPASAALEERLRSMVLDTGVAVPGKAGISVYADALRKIEVISRGEVKDITSWADQRNEAARCHFDDLSRDPAQIVVDG